MRAAIFTLDTGAYKAKAESAAATALKRMLEHIGFEVKAAGVLPEEKDVLASVIKQLCDSGSVELILTTGSVGYQISDCAPDAVLETADRILPGIQILLHESKGIIRLPIRQATLKYFYKDYKNYYYLPEEDTAIHKSIGQFVDRDHKVAATKETCYQKKTGNFIRIPKPGPLPCFQTDCKSKEYFAEFDPVVLLGKNKSACIQILSDYIQNLKPWSVPCPE